MIPVTKPYLPQREAYEAYIKSIWQRGWLTNSGPLVLELEAKLSDYLQIPHVLLLNNGTIALQIALKALGIKGDVITTPFSYVATTSSIVWEGCRPVFVDIDPETLNLDAKKIEAAITPRTEAILATHVYGNPCDVEEIAAIAKKHNLKVIYDAAHAFGTIYKGKSLYAYGDISTASFHATKLFHTIEGGAVITENAATSAKMALLRNFGHTSPVSFDGVGINGKVSEFHAAMGLLVLNDIDQIIAKRAELSNRYTEKLVGTALKRPAIFDLANTSYNHAYYPVIFPNEVSLLKVMQNLEKHEIFTRRYFFPSLNTINYVDNAPCPVSEDFSTRVLCLPLYHTLTIDEVDTIAKLIVQYLD
ncbi:DegT/DnrJ/EryC1/StrS family aminotransferase [soil metagenome]